MELYGAIQISTFDILNSPYLLYLLYLLYSIYFTILTILTVHSTLTILAILTYYTKVIRVRFIPYAGLHTQVQIWSYLKLSQAI